MMLYGSALNFISYYHSILQHND